MKLKRNLRAAALGFALAALAALSPLGIETATAKTLVFCSEGPPWGFDPAPYKESTTHDASSLPLYNRLVELERGTTNLIPGLAESWSFSDDGTEVTFHLRRGVKFHSTPYFTPTRDFNADDVMFSFLRQWEKKHPWHEYNPERSWIGFNRRGMDSLIVDIRRDDDYTVTFVLEGPYALILADMALDFASILSAEYATLLEASNSKPNLNTHPIGTGPFQFVTYLPDELIRYKANPNYWNGVQAIDDLIFLITHDDSERYEKLIAGECHVASYLFSPEDVESLRQEPGIIVLEKVGLNINYLAYNTQKPPFDNVNVRKALNMAINKQAIVDAVFQGTARVAENLIPRTLWSHNQSTQDDRYSPKAARALLEREGVSSLKMTIWASPAPFFYLPAYRMRLPNARLIAERIQVDFAEVGVEVKVVSWLEKGESRDGVVYKGQPTGSNEPSKFLAELLCNYNLANWCHKDFDNLYWRALQTRNKSDRTQLYGLAQLISKHEAPWATIAHELELVPMSARVIGYKVDPNGYHRFDGVDLLE